MTGDPRIDELIIPVSKAIKSLPTEKRIEIYNRAWEAIAKALDMQPPTIKKSDPLHEALVSCGAIKK